MSAAGWTRSLMGGLICWPVIAAATLRRSSRERTIRSVRVRSFNELFEELDERIQRLARSEFAKFKANPSDPSLDTEILKPTKRGRHTPGSRSVRVTLRYRAIYRIDRGLDGKGEETAVWYWIGSHEAYNNFIGSK